MTQLARPLFILLLVVGTILISATTDHLPAQIASHFGAGGVPNGWMSRSFYLLFMLAFAVILPLVIVLSMGVLPRSGSQRDQHSESRLLARPGAARGARSTT